MNDRARETATMFAVDTRLLFLASKSRCMPARPRNSARVSRAIFWTRFSAQNHARNLGENRIQGIPRAVRTHRFSTLDSCSWRSRVLERSAFWRVRCGKRWWEMATCKRRWGEMLTAGRNTLAFVGELLPFTISRLARNHQ